MKKETLAGLGFLAVSNVLYSVFSISNFITGLTLGLGFCFLIIGLLPPRAYNAVKNARDNRVVRKLQFLNNLHIKIAFLQG